MTTIGANMRRLIIVLFFLSALGCYADTLSTSIRAHVVGRHVSSGGAVDTRDVVYGRTLTSGYGDDNADRIYHADATVTSTTAVIYDLSSGLTDAFGGVASFATIKGIALVNESQTDSITATGTHIGSFTVQPDGCAVLSYPLTGLPVSSSAASLHISIASGTSAAYKLTVIGTSR